MKTRTRVTARRASLILIAVAVLALAAVQSARAATYYWDTNDTTAGFGTAGGTWGTNAYWSTSNAGTATPTVTSPTIGDDLNFGNTTTGLAAGTIAVFGTDYAKTLTFASGSGEIILSGGEINLAAASTITVNNTTNTISSEISGAATSLTKAGAGILTLSGANTYTGTTTVSSGTLSVSNLQNAGVNSNIGAYATAGAAGISLGGATLKYTGGTASTNRGFTTTGNATIDVPLGVTLTLGACTVTGGNVTAAGGGTVSLGAVTMGASKAFNTTTGNLTIASLAMGTYSVIFDTSTGTGYGTTITGAVTGSGNVTKTGATAGYLTLSGPNTYTGATILQKGSLSVSSLNSVNGGTPLLASSSLGAPITVALGTIKMGTGTSTPVATLVYTGTGEITDRVIDLAGTTAGATLDQSGTGLLKFTSWTGTANTFTATGAGSKTLTLQGSTAGTGEIAAVIPNYDATRLTSLAKAGTGTWTLSAANTYTGAITVGSATDPNSGTLTLRGSNQAASATIYSGTLNVDAANGGSLPSTAGVTFGLGSTKNKGGGTFIYNFAPGGGSVNLGTLNVIGDNGGGNFGDDTLQVTRTTGLATLTFSANAGNHFGPTLNFVADANPANAKIVLTGQAAGWLYKSSDVNYAMRYYFNGADYAWYDSTGYVRAINYTTPDTGAVTNSGGTSAASTAHLQLTGNLTAQNNATFDTLKLVGTSSIALSSGQKITINNFGGILKAGSGTSTITGGSGITTGTDTCFRVDDPDGVLAYDGVLSSGVNIRFSKSGAGTLRFTGASNIFRHSNDYINGGVLEIAGAGTVNAGTSSLNIAIATDALFRWNSSATQTMNNLIYGGGGVTVNAGTLTLTGTNTYTGLTTVSAGTLTLGHASDTLAGAVTVSGGTLNVANPDTVGAVMLSSGTISGSGTLTGTSYSLTDSGTISAVLTGSVPLTKTGAGTATLSNANTYSGATTVSNGKLLVNNTTGSGTGTGAVTVSSGGTLGGTGAIGGAVNVLTGGTLAPGASVGTLTLGGALTLAGNALFEIDGMNPGDYDRVIVGTALTYGGTLTIKTASMMGPFDLDLFDFTSKTGTFTSISDQSGNYAPGQLSMAYDTGVLTGIPEPATMALLAFGGLGLILGRKRR